MVFEVDFLLYYKQKSAQAEEKVKNIQKGVRSHNADLQKKVDELGRTAKGETQLPRHR